MKGNQNSQLLIFHARSQLLWGFWHVSTFTVERLPIQFIHIANKCPLPPLSLSLSPKINWKLYCLLLRYCPQKNSDSSVKWRWRFTHDYYFTVCDLNILDDLNFTILKFPFFLFLCYFYFVPIFFSLSFSLCLPFLLCHYASNSVALLLSSLLFELLKICSSQHSIDRYAWQSLK